MNQHFENELKKAELIKELREKVEAAINGDMDWVRSRAYWAARLVDIDTALLAEALAYALDRAHAKNATSVSHQIADGQRTGIATLEVMMQKILNEKERRPY